jgi:hypothetical protein
VQEIPPIPRRVELLGELIARKEATLAEYVRRWPAVDLVVADGSRLFRFQDFKQFFAPFSLYADREKFARSKFREIFLLTFEKDERVTVPLRLNLFVEDALVLESLILEELEDDRNEDGSRLFRILAHCLSELGYGNLQAVTVEDGLAGIVAGAHLYLFTPSGKIIRRYVAIPHQMPAGNVLRKAAGRLEGPDVNVARTILGRRPELCCDVRFCFPVENVTSLEASEW